MKPWPAKFRFSLVLTALAVASPAAAVTRYVTGTLCAGCTPPSYDTLQAAFNAASSGDTIILQKNVTECATINNTGIGGYNLTVAGDPNAGSIPYTWIGCGGASNTININANTSGVTFYNLAFDQPSGTGAVWNQNLHQNILFYDTYITRSSATAGDIIDLTANNPSAVTFLNSTIIGNANTNNGIHTTGGSAGTAYAYLINSVIAGISNGYGFQAAGGDTANIQNSTIANNMVGLWNNSANPGDVVTNTLFSNSAENFLWNDCDCNGAQVTAEKANFQNNAFNSSPSYDGWTGAPVALVWGASNITGINPATEFANSAGNNFHLVSGAQSIDKGQTIGSITTDHDGVSRPQGPAYDIGAYEFVCPASTQTYYLTNGTTNSQNTSTDYFDLSPVAGSASNGIHNQANNDRSASTAVGGFGGASDNFFQMGNANYASPNTPPGAVPNGYGFESPTALPGNIPAGTWIFSNDVSGQLPAGNPNVYVEAAVYAYNGAANTLLFTAISPTNISGSFSTEDVSFPTTFNVSEPAFFGVSGQFLKVEYYMHLQAYNAYAGMWTDLGFNTSNDFITMPMVACTPVNTPTFTPTPTPPPSCSPMNTTFHLVSTPVAAIPAGLLMQATNTGNSGFTPTTIIGATPMYWYSPPITGTYLQQTYNLVLWTSSPGSASNVSVTLGYSNPNGSGYVALGNITEDVNASGAGNHTTSFPIPNVGPVTLTNQVLVLTIVAAGGTNATMVFNGGTDFDTFLTTPAGFTPGCTCPYFEQAETAGINDKILYIASQATADPSGWTTVGFNDSAWANAMTWTLPTGPAIFGIPWMSRDANGTGTAPPDKQLIRHSFTIPGNAISITTTLNLAVDDNSASSINGTVIQSDPGPATFITNQMMRTWTVPAGIVTTGNNVLAIDNGNSQAQHMGYDFQLAIVYTTNCLAPPTNTPTNSPTSTPTPSPTNTPTSTPVITNTPTVTPTLTNTPAPTATPVGLHVWPNPFDPKYAVGGVLKAYQVPPGSTMSYYTVSGELVRTLPESNGVISWDSRNNNGVEVSTGTYYYVIQSGNAVLLTGKILVLISP